MKTRTLWQVTGLVLGLVTMLTLAGCASVDAKSPECCTKYQELTADLSPCCKANLGKAPADRTGCCTEGMQAGNANPPECCAAALAVQAQLPACCVQSQAKGDADCCPEKR